MMSAALAAAVLADFNIPPAPVDDYLSKKGKCRLGTYKYPRGWHTDLRAARKRQRQAKRLNRAA